MTNGISAIILAAGYSRRMGTLKATLKLGDRTVLERSIGLFRDLGIKDVIVVTGHGAEQIAPIVYSCGVRAILNTQFEQGMFSSVQSGVKAVKKSSHAFFVLPVDIPLVRPQTIRDLLEGYQMEKGQILFPMFLGKRGHPPLVDACYRNEILSYSGEGGLRAIFRNHEEESINVEVADEMILSDLDTPDDYTAFVSRFR